MSKTYSPSFKFSDYIVPPSAITSCYQIVDEQSRDDSITVFRGYLRNTNTLIEITKTIFIPSPQNVHRLQALIKAYQESIILVNKIFLVQSQDKRALHPSNILVERKCAVYLRPFAVDFLNSSCILSPRLFRKNNNNDSFTKTSPPPTTWLSYEAPEYLFNAPEFQDTKACDVWTLGCIFFQIFVSVTPLFQSFDPYEKLMKIFNVMGVPLKQDLPYVSDNSYKLILQMVQTAREGGRNNRPLILQWSHMLQKQEVDLLLGFLELNSRKRIDIEMAEMHQLFLHYFSEKPISEQVGIVRGVYSNENNQNRQYFDENQYLMENAVQELERIRASSLDNEKQKIRRVSQSVYTEPSEEQKKVQEFRRHASINPIHRRYIKNAKPDKLSVSQLTNNKSLDISQKPIIMYKVQNMIKSQQQRRSLNTSYNYSSAPPPLHPGTKINTQNEVPNLRHLAKFQQQQQSNSSRSMSSISQNNQISYDYQSNSHVSFIQSQQSSGRQPSNEVFGIDGNSIAAAQISFNQYQPEQNSQKELQKNLQYYNSGSQMRYSVRTAAFRNSDQNQIYVMRPPLSLETQQIRSDGYNSQPRQDDQGYDSKKISSRIPSIGFEDKQNCILNSQNRLSQMRGSKLPLNDKSSNVKKENSKIDGFIRSGKKAQPKKEKTVQKTQKKEADNHLIIEVKKFINLELPAASQKVFIKFELPSKTTSVQPTTKFNQNLVRFKECVEDYMNTELHFRVPIHSKIFSKQYKTKPLQLMLSSERVRHSSFIDDDDDDCSDHQSLLLSPKNNSESLLGFVKLDLIMLFSHYTNHEINGYFHIYKSPNDEHESMGQMQISMRFQKKPEQSSKSSEYSARKQQQQQQISCIVKKPPKLQLPVKFSQQSNYPLSVPNRNNPYGNRSDFSDQNQEYDSKNYHSGIVQKISNYLSFDADNPLSEGGFEQQSKIDFITQSSQQQQQRPISDLAKVEMEMESLKENLESWEKKSVKEKFKSKLIFSQDAGKVRAGRRFGGNHSNNNSDFAETLAQLKQMIFSEQ